LIEPGSQDQNPATGGEKDVKGREGKGRKLRGFHRIDEVPAKQVSGHQLTHILSLAECNN